MHPLTHLTRLSTTATGATELATVLPSYPAPVQRPKTTFPAEDPPTALALSKTQHRLTLAFEDRLEMHLQHL